MTTPRRDAGEDRTPFGAWVRHCPALDSIRDSLTLMDVDWVFHQYAYRTQRGGQSREIQNIMFVEEKQRAANVSRSQADTLSMAGKLINRKMKDRPISATVPSVFTPGAEVRARFWGFFVLQFSGTCPTDSKHIWWDQQPVTTGELIELLSFKRSPISLRVRNERNHHGGTRQKSFKNL